MDSKELTPQQTFQAQVADRLREDVGKMIPDEVLAEMVEKAIQEMFFTRKTDRSNYQQQQFPSWFEDEVSKTLKEYIDTNMKAHFVLHGDEINVAIVDAIKESMPAMIGEMISGAVFGAGSTVGMNLGMQISDSIQNSMIR